MPRKGLLLENNHPEKGFLGFSHEDTESAAAVLEVGQTTSQTDSRIGQYCPYGVDLADM